MTEAQHQKKKHRTITFKVRHLIISLIVLLIVVLAFTQLTNFNKYLAVTEKTSLSSDVQSNLEKSSDSEALTEIVKTEPVPKSKKIQRLLADIKSEPYLGNEDAPVAIIVFTDYTNEYYPYFLTEVLPRLKDKYINKGLVKLVFKDFPESFERKVKLDANLHIIINCGMEENTDKFMVLQDFVINNLAEFKAQQRSEDFLRPFQYDLYVRNSQEYLPLEKCFTYSSNPYNEGNFHDEIKEDYEEGKKLGVVVTPTFFIGSKKIEGVEGFPIFDNEILKVLEEETDDALACSGDKDCPYSDPYCLHNKCSSIQCKESSDCPTDAPHCLQGGICDALECKEDSDCNYYNGFGIQECINICKKYQEKPSGKRLCEQNSCGCECLSGDEATATPLVKITYYEETKISSPVKEPPKDNSKYEAYKKCINDAKQEYSSCREWQNSIKAEIEALLRSGRDVSDEIRGLRTRFLSRSCIYLTTLCSQYL